MCVFSFYDVTVSLDGNSDFSSIQEAIAHAPQDHSPYAIFIRRGVYQESFEINRPNIILIGEDRDETIVTASVANGMLDASGRKFATYGSRTISINASDFSARFLTIRNDFDFPANQRKPESDPTRLRHTQSVALLIAPQADRVQLHQVCLISYHDTCYIYAGRSYIRDSMITGTVDFIFGGGTALFESCDVVARYRDDVSDSEPFGYLVAPCTSIKQSFGLVFKHCRLTKELSVPAKTYGLGRPWHPTTEFEDGNYADPDAIGHAAFLYCEMDDHLYGWDKMSGRDKSQQTVWFYPQDSRFWEYQCSGLGAAGHERPQLSRKQAETYTTEGILADWIPEISQSAGSVQGQVTSVDAVFPATVSVTDSLGQLKTVQTDELGDYQVSVDTMLPPLLLSVSLGQGTTGENLRALIPVVHSDASAGEINLRTEQFVVSCEQQVGQQIMIGQPVLPVPRQVLRSA